MPKPLLGIMVDTMDIPDTMAMDMVMVMVWEDTTEDLDTDMVILMATLIMVKCLSFSK